ncbi:serine/threonine-protein kinase [Amycolatopsis nigrescens]|uniref:serine/threonine-protein kinase n=1 Tax=Amycolatopsis nigrescens TaxID=381445 RepID=UPI0003A49FE3|nr:serine/threonine-protein kinase [Amycolatopsis nigrescens]
MRAGQLIADRYRLREPVGSGGMGEVWRAYDEELHRVVAVKYARGDAPEPEDRGMRREARIAAGLQHPHVITVHDVVVEAGARWLVMEYLPSRSLAETLDERGHLPVPEAAGIGVQIADALEAVHARGVVHRDVKPGNILVTEDGLAKLADFGISRAVWGELTLTEGGAAAGTPAYLSPEVADGGEPHPASDMFSLGASLYAAVEGGSPFGDSENPLAILRKAAAGEIAPMRRSGALTPVLTALLRRDPAKRPDAAETRRLLEQIVRDGGTGPIPGPVGKPDRRARGRCRAVFAAAGLVATALALLWVVLPTDSPTDQPGPSASADLPKPVAAVGDTHTADPCALLDQAALAPFGELELETDYGNFDRCDLVVTSGEKSEVDVEMQFEPVTAPIPGESRPLEVRREAESDGECERTVLLGDQNRVVVTAQQNKDGPADLCRMADAATDGALAVLGRGTVPRRTVPIDPRSLANANACGLLDNTALAKIPGVDANHPDIGFGGWDCGWSSTTSDVSVKLRFDRHQPLTASDGRPMRLAGRDAFIEPEGDGDDTCVARIVHRPYTDDDGKRAVELAFLVVSGPQPSEWRCTLATDLAKAAAGALPPL